MTGVRTVPLCIAADHPSLPGHFPGNPLVPGVVVLERVAAAWKAWRGQTVGKFDAKFVQPLRPGEDAAITLHDEGGRLFFEVTRADGRALARGTFVAADTLV
jgi:3-hydroxymyristoyl/3-hydroxydecanoyl-(acyl carrier protein) dehydratase